MRLRMMDYAMSVDRSGASREKNGRFAGNNQNLALAMAYVPMQCLKNAYSLETALLSGTLFPELDKPFTGVRGGCACG